MFLVFDKKKICSYLITLSIVTILFTIAATYKNYFGDAIQTTIQTSGEAKLLPIYNVKTNEQKIAFTMNCAWGVEDLDSILNTLEKNNIKITFFMVGDFVDKYPEYVKKISEKGHEIANHSNTHPHVNNLNIEKNMQEIKSCSEKIEKITGKKTNLYRGPYGEYNNNVINAASNENHQTIQWNLDTLDYNGLTGEEMWKRLNGKLSAGSIILSHNGTKHTADSLDFLINNIKSAGYEIVTVSDLIYKENFMIDVNGTQIKK